MKMALANAMNNAGVMRTVVKIVRLLTEKSPRDAIPEVVALLNENEPTKPVQRQRLAKVLFARHIHSKIELPTNAIVLLEQRHRMAAFRGDGCARKPCGARTDNGDITR